MQRLFVHAFPAALHRGELDQALIPARFETLCTLFLILVLLVDVFILYRESNHKYVHSYQNQIRDPLTRLYNRSFFYDTLNQQLAKVNAQHPLSVLISDLDHFKRINDSYGHVAGDKVIQFAASVLESHSRVDDAAARIGDEEFALLLVNTGEKEAQSDRRAYPPGGQCRGEPFTGANDYQHGGVYHLRQ